MSKLHEFFERSTCDCSKCTAACMAMPGYLVPGDVERIAEYVGADPDDEKFLAANFRASEGVLVAKHGQLFRIPTIVPAQYDDNGRCVFLTRDGKCSVHAVSPFGCSRFSVCEPPSWEAEQRSKAGLSDIMSNLDYNLLWAWLCEHGHRAPPLAERRRRLSQKLHETQVAQL
jgi:Fe-S-cluster containining protein